MNADLYGDPRDIGRKRVRRRILVVANEAAATNTLYAAVRSLAEGDQRTEVLVIAPALNSRLHHWLSDEDGARKAALRRLQVSVARLSRAGVDADGMIGDADPLQAIEDALRVFQADRLIVSTHAERRSNWLARNLVGKAESRFGLPVTHIVVDTCLGHDAVARHPAGADLAA